MSIYDFGGWYEGREDEERLRINAFKESFGGTVAQGWNAERLITLKARIAFLLARKLRRIVKRESR